MRSGEGDLQNRRGEGVPHQMVRVPHGTSIERTSGGYAHMRMAGPSQILGSGS